MVSYKIGNSFRTWIIYFGICLGLISSCAQQPDRVAKPFQPPNQESTGPSDLLPDQFAPQGSFYPIMTTPTDRLAHRRGCPRLEQGDQQGREYFRAFAPAKAKGYRACPQCRPDRSE
jgi:hypothetical protein